MPKLKLQPMSPNHPQARADVVRSLIDEYPTREGTLATMCQHWGISVGMFHTSLAKDEELQEAWANAKKARAMVLMEAVLEEAHSDQGDMREIKRVIEDEDGSQREVTVSIHNTPAVSRSKLKVAAMQWAAAKLDPETFGDRVINDNRVSGTATLVIGDSAQAAKMIEERRARIRSNATDVADIKGDTKSELPE